MLPVKHNDLWADISNQFAENGIHFKLYSKQQYESTMGKTQKRKRNINQISK